MGDNSLAKAHRLSTCTGGQTMYNYLPLGVSHMFSNLSTFRENANNEESDQIALWGEGF